MKVSIKRIFDILSSLLLVFLLLPLFLLLAILIIINLGKPVFFTQARVGKSGNIFNIIKFKSMLDSSDSITDFVSDKKRMTKFGKWLRSSSLDEVPQLINILKGEMSFVGPRPWPAKYFNVYSKEQFRRHNAQPGVTGWAQINGRNSISWCDKIKMDLYYIDNQSLALDCKILIRTVPVFIKRGGIEIQEEFTGTN